MHAAGFPYYSIAGTSLNLTGGNVSALAGVDDDRRFFTFSAPVQPGNSGGPLIDARGAVRGLVVARLSEDYIVEATGSLPQNVNYALGEAELARFLRQHGVEPAPGGLGGYDMDDGAPAEFDARRGADRLPLNRPGRAPVNTPLRSRLMRWTISFRVNCIPSSRARATPRASVPGVPRHGGAEGLEERPRHRVVGGVPLRVPLHRHGEAGRGLDDDRLGRRRRAHSPR